MRACVIPLILATTLLVGCHKQSDLPQDARTAHVDRQVRAKWGKGLDELPTVTLVMLSAHNENIMDEFQWAFSLDHALKYGQKVVFDRREVGGGGTSMETALLNIYQRGQTPGFDILWGGGDFPYVKLARGVKDESTNQPTGPLLEKLVLSPDVLANTPAEFAGMALLDKDHRWIGSTLSGFGIIYNKGILAKCGRTPPRNWQDLGDDRFHGLLELADPLQSGSAAAAYQTIVVSASDWPSGWARLMMVLGNAKRYADSSGSAANAPALGESPVATCIDFYGAMRVVEAPDQLEYFTPAGESIFTPDPIAILKGTPHPELAQRFVDFVLSQRGQALWALQVGQPDGPVRKALGRQPIRRDVYTTCGQMLPFILDPYAAGKAIVLTPQKKAVNFTVLRELVGAAAIANRQGLLDAKAALIRSGHRADLEAEFVALPANVATLDAMKQTAAKLSDKAALDTLRTDWQAFFKSKYERIQAASKEARP